MALVYKLYNSLRSQSLHVKHKTENLESLEQRLEPVDSISLSWNGSSLTKCESFEHLGVVIDKHLSFNSHIEHTVNKVSRKLVLLGVWESLFPWWLLNSITRLLSFLISITVMWPGTAVVKLTLMYSRGYSIELQRNFPNPGLDTKTLNATLGLVPLINRRKLYIVFLARNFLDGSVPPSE